MRASVSGSVNGVVVFSFNDPDDKLGRHEGGGA